MQCLKCEFEIEYQTGPKTSVIKFYYTKYLPNLVINVIIYSSIIDK